MNNLKSRLAKEKRFRLYGVASITLALFLLSLLFVSIFSQGYTAFQETKIQLNINFSEEILDPNKTKDWEIIKKSNFSLLVKNSVNELFPNVSGRSNKRKLKKIISSSAEYQLRDYVKNNINTRVKNFNTIFNHFKKYEEFFVLPNEFKGLKTGWLAFPLIIKSQKKILRKNLQIFLEKNGIQTRTIFTGNILRQPIMKSQFYKKNTKGVLNLHLHLY